MADREWQIENGRSQMAYFGESVKRLTDIPEALSIDRWTEYSQDLPDGMLGFVPFIWTTRAELDQ